MLEPRITHYIQYSTVLVSLRSTSPPLDGTGGRSALIRFALACFCLRRTQTKETLLFAAATLAQPSALKAIVLVSTKRKNLLTYAVRGVVKSSGFARAWYIVHWPSSSKTYSHVVGDHSTLLTLNDTQCWFKPVVQVEQTRSYRALATLNYVSKLVRST